MEFLRFNDVLGIKEDHGVFLMRQSLSDLGTCVIDIREIYEYLDNNGGQWVVLANGQTSSSEVRRDLDAKDTSFVFMLSSDVPLFVELQGEWGACEMTRSLGIVEVFRESAHKRQWLPLRGDPSKRPLKQRVQGIVWADGTMVFFSPGEELYSPSEKDRPLFQLIHQE